MTRRRRLLIAVFAALVPFGLVLAFAWLAGRELIWKKMKRAATEAQDASS